jgi:uncharacterized membrane protein
MSGSWKDALGRWTAAALIDAATAERIRAFEEQRRGTGRLQWPAWIALAFGALMLGAGMMLFVSAYWDAISPATQFFLALVLVVLFHASAAAAVARFPAVATTLSALGTVSLGAGIFLTGQIFNLDAHWPAGLLLWTVGAAAAWALLRDPVQMAMTAVLAPAWLVGEWAASLSASVPETAFQVQAAGCFLLSLAYFTASSAARRAPALRVLMWLGGISLPLTAMALAVTGGHSTAGFPAPAMPVPIGVWVLGWSVALVAPWIVAVLVQRSSAWPQVAAGLWVAAEVHIHAHLDAWVVHAWWAIGAIALAAWGVRDGRGERVNMACAMFAATVLAFYSSHVMGGVGRSASLIGLGLLFLVGGWALERARRRLVSATQGDRS